MERHYKKTSVTITFGKLGASFSPLFLSIATLWLTEEIVRKGRHNCSNETRTQKSKLRTDDKIVNKIG